MYRTAQSTQAQATTGDSRLETGKTLKGEVVTEAGAEAAADGGNHPMAMNHFRWTAHYM